MSTSGAPALRSAFAFAIFLNLIAPAAGRPSDELVGAGSTSLPPTVPLRDCDENWFTQVLSSKAYRDFLRGRVGPRDIPALDYGKIALANSLAPTPCWLYIARAWRFGSNPYVAAALFIGFEDGYSGHPYGSAHGLLAEFVFWHRNRDMSELEAAMFAHIKNKRSFKKLHWLRTHRWVGRKYEETNMYAAFAEALCERNEPYMAIEWKRLAGFRRNPEVRAAATSVVSDAKPTAEAHAFSAMVADLKDLRKRARTYSILEEKPVVPDARDVALETREFDVSSIRFGPSITYSIDTLLGFGRAMPRQWHYPPRYCERVSKHKVYRRPKKGRDYLTDGPLVLRGTPNNLDRISELFEMIEKRHRGAVEFDRSRLAVVFPTDKLSDNDRLREFSILFKIAPVTHLVPQGVLVVHTDSANRAAVEQILDAIDAGREVTVPWADGTQVAILRRDAHNIPCCEEGREFLWTHLPPTEDCRFVDLSVYGRYTLLKASPATIEHVKSLTAKPTGDAP